MCQSQIYKSARYEVWNAGLYPGFSWYSISFLDACIVKPSNISDWNHAVLMILIWSYVVNRSRSRRGYLFSSSEAEKTMFKNVWYTVFQQNSQSASFFDCNFVVFFRHFSAARTSGALCCAPRCWWGPGRLWLSAITGQHTRIKGTFSRVFRMQPQGNNW